MTVRLLHVGQFYLRRFFLLQPRVAASVLAAVGLVLGAALVAAQQSYERQSAEDALESAIREAKQARISLLKAPTPVSEQMALPEFDSAELVGTLHRVAADVKLPFDEVSYALEESTGQPYLRYRMTLSVTGNYPAIRRFSDSFRREASHVTLDSISCSRDDISAAELSCDLGLSAFYRKVAHG
jgi:Tfp pilus assembly protein PilO